MRQRNFTTCTKSRGFVGDRLLSRRTMLGLPGIGMGAASLCALMAQPDWPLPLLIVHAALFGATALGWNAVYLAEVARLAPDGQISQATGSGLGRIEFPT